MTDLNYIHYVEGHKCFFCDMSAPALLTIILPTINREEEYTFFEKITKYGTVYYSDCNNYTPSQGSRILTREFKTNEGLKWKNKKN